MTRTITADGSQTTASQALQRCAELLGGAHYEAAARHVEQAIGIQGETGLSCTLQGLCSSGLGRHAQALASFDRALELQPGDVPATINRGTTLRALGRPAEALACYDRLLASAPESFEVFNNRAAALLDLRRFREALHDAERALALRADRAQTHLNRAAALTGLGRDADALLSLDRAVRLQESAEARIARSQALLQLGRLGEARLEAQRAVTLMPRSAAAHAVHGTAQRELGDTGKALESFQQATALAPEDAQLQFNLGCLHLLRGEFEQGWPLYERRQQLREIPTVRRLPQPRWTRAVPTDGKSVLIYADQGLGDTLQFIRYVPLLEQQGARVLLSVQSGLKRLLTTLSPTVQLLGEAETPATFDYQCPLSSLPGAFDTRLGTIPAGASYLRAEADRSQDWAARLGPAGFRIGVCWRGSTVAGGTGRAFPLHLLTQLAALPQVRLISLLRAPERGPLDDTPPGVRIEWLGEALDRSDTFIDTAAVMAHLDLIISCDTSIAHLAGALGCRAWIVLKRAPDWRWLLDRPDSPWYPSLRLLRQQVSGRWDDVFANLHHDIAGLIAQAGEA